MAADDARWPSDADRPSTGDYTGDDDTETLRRRLRDTVKTCQRLASALDARHGSSTTYDVFQSNHSVCTAQLLANIDEVCRVVAIRVFIA